MDLLKKRQAADHVREKAELSDMDRKRPREKKTKNKKRSPRRIWKFQLKKK